MTVKSPATARLVRLPSSACVQYTRSGVSFYALESEGQVKSGTCTGKTQVGTLAGSTAGYADGPASSALFNSPRGIAVGPDGALYVADTNNRRIRKVDTSGNVTTIAGSGVSGHLDGQGTSARFTEPSAIAVANDGTVYVGDAHRIRAISSTGYVSTLAGSSTEANVDGQGASASFTHITSIAVAADGKIFVSNVNPDGIFGNRIRTVSAAGLVTTLPLPLPNTAELGVVVAAPDGGVYVARDDDGNGIYKVTSDGNMTLFFPTSQGWRVIQRIAYSNGAFYGASGGSVGNGPAFSGIYAVVEPTGSARMAGSTTLGYGFQDGNGDDARFESGLGGLAVGQGVLYYADPYNNRIRTIR